jgi:hypothetical protein
MVTGLNLYWKHYQLPPFFSILERQANGGISAFSLGNAGNKPGDKPFDVF